ncbi:MAG: PBP1A family penicillin-binding protein [Sphingobium sp.]|nr:PBP1A family penicillin-binding protein [Sphingobium sp.]
MAKTKSVSRARLWTIRALKIGLALGLGGFFALAIAVVIAMQSLPSFDSLKSSPNGQMIRVHAIDGTVIVQLGPSYGRWLSYEQMPKVMVDALVSTEDKRFYMHPGVDPIGMARIVYVAYIKRGTGSRLQGASTITQQLARNIFLNQAYTAGRKLREGVLALAMERKFTKQQILELYLNKMYFGGGAYGVDAASRKFFNHPGTDLSIAEAAVIAGMLKAPSHYSPTADVEAARGRAGVVLDLMEENGAISRTERAAVDLDSVKMAPDATQDSVRYFTDWALPQLDTLVDERDQPLDVYTTIDLRLQRAAVDSLRAHAPEGAQGALVSMDRDGAVRAMVGGLDYVSSNYNRATVAERQPGSSFKLFVYLTALEAGYMPDTAVTDSEVTIDGWTPRNDNRKFAGDIDVRTAFAYSINTVAAKLGMEVGFPNIASMARRFGISTTINTHPSMVLGTSEVHLLDMTQAFAEVARKGVGVTPYGILKVTTSEGEVLYQHQDDTSRVLVAPWVAAGMTDLMQTAVNTGTGRNAQIGRPVAGKTGTTTSNKDGWFIGFSSGLTTGVWMGRDDGKAVGGLAGGRAPARAFADYMKIAVSNRPVENFDTGVTLPEWQLEPDDEAYGLENRSMAVDADGNPIETDSGVENPERAAGAGANGEGEAPQRIDQKWIDSVLGRQPARAPAPTPGQATPTRPAPAAPSPATRPTPAQTPRPTATPSARPRTPAPATAN